MNGKEFEILEEPPKELNYNLLKDYLHCTIRELAILFRMNEKNLRARLKKLEKEGFIKISPSFTTKLTWIRHPQK